MLFRSLAARGELYKKDDSKDEVKEQKEVMIQWPHIMKALENTRASISEDESRRLKKIYSEFVTARSGDMPSGQGGTEVGGRTTLA